jgi:hypothetical protein
MSFTDTWYEAGRSIGVVFALVVIAGCALIAYFSGRRFGMGMQGVLYVLIPSLFCCLVGSIVGLIVFETKVSRIGGSEAKQRAGTAELDAARAHFHSHPQDADAAMLWARELRNQHRASDARPLIEKAVELAPDRADLWEEKAQFHDSILETSKARDARAKAAELRAAGSKDA